MIICIVALFSACFWYANGKERKGMVFLERTMDFRYTYCWDVALERMAADS